MLKHAIAWTAVAGLILSEGACNRANRNRQANRNMPAPEARAGESPAPAPDIAFLQAAAMSGNAEIELSDLATHQGASEQVRRFARMMVDDHTSLNSEIVQLARSMNVTVPSQPSTRHRAVAERLQGLQGAEFDREYLRQMLDDHQTAVALFENKASTAQEPRIRDLAGRSLPVLRHHLDMARQLSSQLPNAAPTAPDSVPDTRTIPPAGSTPSQPSTTPMGSPTGSPITPGGTPTNSPGTTPPASPTETPSSTPGATPGATPAGTPR